jgi:hypothetical protein
MRGRERREANERKGEERRGEEKREANEKRRERRGGKEGSQLDSSLWSQSQQNLSR